MNAFLTIFIFVIFRDHRPLAIHNDWWLFLASGDRCIWVSLIKLGLVILFVLAFRERGNGWVSTVWDVAGGIFHGVTS
jgi:hypothetical protein